MFTLSWVSTLWVGIEVRPLARALKVDPVKLFTRFVCTY